jgi:hypothetical protein
MLANIRFSKICHNALEKMLGQRAIGSILRIGSLVIAQGAGQAKIG